MVVLVCLLVFDERAILVIGEVFSVNILEEGKVFCTIVERLIAQHSVVDEQFQVVPFLLEALAVFLEEALQTVAHLFGDVCGDFLYITVTLQI